jgi:hypothetical protein
MPVTLLYGSERARVARLVLSLLRTVRNAYTPELTLEEASEFLFLMMHLFIGHAQRKPLSASRLARIAEIPRTTVLRRLAALIEFGYVERIGNSYYLTAKSNVPNQRRVLLEHQQHPARCKRTVQNGHPSVDRHSLGSVAKTTAFFCRHVSGVSNLKTQEGWRIARSVA